MTEARLEAIRQYCQVMLGDQVTEVRSSVRDHGGWAGIGIRESDGYRHGVALRDGDTAEEVAVALQDAIDQRRLIPSDWPLRRAALAPGVSGKPSKWRLGERPIGRPTGAGPKGTHDPTAVR